MYTMPRIFALAMGLPLAWCSVANAGAPFRDADGAVSNYRQPSVRAYRACAELQADSHFDFTIVSAREVPASDAVPAHCRVSGLIPTEVRFEVNLPLHWNGRLYMFGNGGLAGTPASDPRRQAQRDHALGYAFATVYTDTGHDRRIEPGGTFAHDNFHKLVDYGFRAVHLSLLAAGHIADAFYGRSPARSYFDGCSTGGRQAMMSAQRFAQDFDGILAGAPAADYSGLKFSQAWRVGAIASGHFSAAEAADLGRRIYAQCDALDGLADGLIDDPRRCDFDPARDLPRCPGDDAVDCYDSAELAALTRYYSDVRIGADVVYPAMPVGSEGAGPGYDGTEHSGWIPWLINPAGPTLLDSLGSDFFRYMAFVRDRPDYNWTDYDFSAPPDNLTEFRAAVDAVSPDLDAFRDRGGKLLSYFGWADPDINPLTLLDYHAAVAARDAQVDDYFRVFMVPGMFHCRGGPGPDRFDAMSALIDWVEAGVPPTRLHATHVRDGNEIYSRPLCAYPARAVLTGADPDDARSFTCRLP